MDILSIPHRQNPLVKGVLIFRISVCFLGALLTAITICVFKRKFCLNRNTSLAVLNFFLLVFLICLFTPINDFRTLAAISGNGTIVWDQFSCVFSNIGAWYFGYAVSYAMFIIAVERTLATMFYRTYSSFPITYGAFLIFLQWFIPATNLYYLLYDMDFYATIPSCTLATANNATRITHTSLVVMVLELSSALVFHFLLRTNRTLLRKHSTAGLSERFQLDQNVHDISLLIPLMWTHFGLNSMAAFLYNLRSGFGWLEQVPLDVFIEIINVLYLYGCILPILFFIQFKVINRRKGRVLEENYVSKERTTRVGSEQQKKAQLAALSEKHERIITRGW